MPAAAPPIVDTLVRPWNAIVGGGDPRRGFAARLVHVHPPRLLPSPPVP